MIGLLLRRRHHVKFAAAIAIFLHSAAREAQRCHCSQYRPPPICRRKGCDIVEPMLRMNPDPWAETGRQRMLEHQSEEEEGDTLPWHFLAGTFI